MRGLTIPVRLFRAAIDRRKAERLGLTLGKAMFIHRMGAFLSLICTYGQNTYRRRWDVIPLWGGKDFHSPQEKLGNVVF